MPLPGKKSAIYGEIVHSGVGKPAEVVVPELSKLSGKSSISPERLDGVIEAMVQNTEMASGLLLQYTPMLAAVMEKLHTELQGVLAQLAPPVSNTAEPLTDVPSGFGSALNLADKMSAILDRVYKMNLNAMRSKDGAVRLQVFLKEGSSSLGSLEHMSENQLRKLITDAAQGWIDNNES